MGQLCRASVTHPIPWHWAPRSPLPGPGTMVFGRAVCERVVQVTATLIWEGSCHGNPSLSFLATGEHLFSIARLRWETLAGGGWLINLGKKKKAEEKCPCEAVPCPAHPFCSQGCASPGQGHQVKSSGVLPGVPAAHLGHFGIILAAGQMARQ